MMKISHHATLFLAALTAAAGCTSAVSNDPKVKAGESAAQDGLPEDKLPEDKLPEDKLPEAVVKVAVGSVLLRSDCRDAPSVDPTVPASIAPAAPKRVPPVSPGVTAPSASRRPQGVARRACEQSTLQITFDNTGAEPATVSAVEATLRDVETDQVVATLPSRKPSKWSEADNAYGDWDQSVAAASSVRTSYRITPPSWSAVEGKLDGKASRGRTYEVDVSLQINGAPATARSAEFTRPPLIPMPPT